MIYCIRHGQTDLNKEKKLQGRQGMPLNEEGLFQANNLKEKLKDITFDYVYSSPQERAIQTAEIATGLNAIIDDRLDVFDLGEANTLKTQEVKWAGAIPDSNVYEGVEDPQAFVQRVFHFMSELKEKHGDREMNILLSGHRCTTGAIGAYFYGIPEDKNIIMYSSDNGEYNIYSFKLNK
ncbi:histidine phosphatase family protein [Bacillus sp. FJAT-45066]|uniref:histidine phosphatase family protein n=1 Tax=Bacillus sp. FJAT-45066 TaxID=2011010 RepID=UPI000BB9156B|nr:histidine phosphatase family protein [Bacillus sp. FJAT-45066]